MRGFGRVRSAGGTGGFDLTSKFLIETGPRDWHWPAGVDVPADVPVRLVDADLSTVSNAPDKLVPVDEPAGPFVGHIDVQ